MKLCYQSSQSDCRILLFQDGPDEFSVRYGSSIKCHLTYNEAALELGAALMHDMACRGVVE